MQGKRVLMVGDRRDDMQGAVNCGLDAAAVLYGYGDREEVAPFAPVFMAADCKELTDWALRPVDELPIPETRGTESMSQKRQQQNETMTPMQHRAVLVCILCVLAVLLTFGITTTLLKKEEPAPSVPESVADPTSGEDLSGHYQIDNASTALLTETADAGTDYLNDTLFLGDSNTVRLYNNGLISLQQFCAKEGIGTQVALNEGIVTFKKDSNHYTIPQAVAMMKPRRVVMTFGTNDTGMEVSDFIAHYTALIQAIQQSYPYTDIIVNTVPPVPADHSNYPHMDQTKIDDFNMALLDLCEQLGVRFLNSAEASRAATATASRTTTPAATSTSRAPASRQC